MVASLPKLRTVGIAKKIAAILALATGLAIASIGIYTYSQRPTEVLIEDSTSAGGGNGSTSPVWTATQELSAWENAESHWRKHQSEFPELKDINEYVEAAKTFFQSPPRGILSKVRPNGDVLYFDPATRTFGVRAADGAPRTMFRPSDGMRYWNRQ